jgi:hypothetical protein
MNLALCSAFTVAFLAAPPSLLIGKWWRLQRIPWWAILLLLALCEWLFWNARVHFWFEYLCEPFQGDWEHHPPELEERFQHCWAGDGGALVFALFFGGVAGLIYSVPFFIAYGIATCIRRARA